mmetsp:Transcript_24722/g.37583  ORF Transcript_24722/g.37583 Transcript_24722/m.37583 type:complete len:209 (+) Transcript_24722:810-1436(+)
MVSPLSTWMSFRDPLQSLLSRLLFMSQGVATSCRARGLTIVLTLLRSKGDAVVGFDFLAQDVASAVVGSARWPFAWSHFESLVLGHLLLPTETGHSTVLLLSADLREGTLLARSSLFAGARDVAQVAGAGPSGPEVSSEGTCRLGFWGRSRSPGNWGVGSSADDLVLGISANRQWVALLRMGRNHGHWAKNDHLGSSWLLSRGKTLLA